MNPRARTPAVSPVTNEQLVKAALAILAAADLHSRTANSIVMAALALVHSQRLSVTAIGTALARLTHIDAKHGVKQVDRLMSSEGFNVRDCLAGYVQAVLGARKSAIVALDWTEFALDGHSTICLYLVSNHGRATPLVWLTVETASLKGQRNHHEDELLRMFKDCLPARALNVIVLADRGFGDVGLYAELKDELKFDFVIRFRRNVLVEHGGERKRADEWLAGAGEQRLRLLRPKMTGSRAEIAAFVAVHDPAMKEPWFLATSLPGSIRAVAALYGRRFTIEETFRDQKDLKFGMGLYETQVTQTARRDRLLFLAALVQVLLTILGAAGEKMGLDRKLRVNTVEKRTHSLFRQGREYLKGLAENIARELGALFQRFVDGLVNNRAQLAEI